MQAISAILWDKVLTMTVDELTDKMITLTSNDYATATRLMVECLQVIPFELPPVAISGVDVARRYWVDGSVPKQETERRRVECWDYLDELSASTNTDEPEFCAIRAVICVLYADPESDDLGEIVDFFNQMLRGTMIEDDENAFSKKVLAIVDKFSREA